MNDPVATRQSIITLTTDFGPDSPYVAEMKGVIYSIHPQVTLVDGTHAVTPQDILQGSFLWKQISKPFPAGTIHLAVVDPGVGTDRRLLLVETADHYWIAPDNGLFSQVVAKEPVRQVLELDRPDYWASHVSATFHGRDIMAPVAAHLSRGEPLEKLGTPTHEPLIQDLPKIQVGENCLSGEVIHIDSFGNLITNIRRADWDAQGIPDHCQATCGTDHAVGLQNTYSEADPQTPVILFGSSGFLEFSIVNGNAAQQLGAQVKTVVQLDWSP
jgi:S-adenosylmethionine hydrolase